MPPPPPPPPPPPGPPPPPAPSGPPKLTKSDANNRSALLGDICKGRALKSTTHLMVDKSKPIIGNEGKSANKFGTISGGLNHNRLSGGSLSCELQKKLLMNNSKNKNSNNLDNFNNKTNLMAHNNELTIKNLPKLNGNSKLNNSSTFVTATTQSLIPNHHNSLFNKTEELNRKNGNLESFSQISHSSFKNGDQMNFSYNSEVSNTNLIFSPSSSLSSSPSLSSNKRYNPVTRSSTISDSCRSLPTANLATDKLGDMESAHCYRSVVSPKVFNRSPSAKIKPPMPPPPPPPSISLRINPPAAAVTVLPENAVDRKSELSSENGDYNDGSC